MKYGMRERVSGAVILLALGVIFIPMLFDDPPAREDRPEPVLTIEQPVEVEQTPVQEPQRPASLGQIQSPQAPSQPVRQAQPDAGQPNDAQPDDVQNDLGTAEQVAGNQPSTDSAAQAGSADAPRPDPIAEIGPARRAGRSAGPAERITEVTRPMKKSRPARRRSPRTATGRCRWAVSASRATRHASRNSSTSRASRPIAARATII